MNGKFIILFYFREGIEPFTREEYDKVKKELKNGKAPDLQGWRYEMVKNAGTDLDESTKERGICYQWTVKEGCS